MNMDTMSMEGSITFPKNSPLPSIRSSTTFDEKSDMSPVNPNEDVSPSGKLSNVEAQRIMSVIQEIQKKIQLINMLPDAIDKRVSSVFSGDTFNLINDHRILELKHKSLIEAKNNFDKSNPVNEHGSMIEIKETCRLLKTSTKSLTRHFLQNTSALNKLRFLKSTKTNTVAQFENLLQEIKLLTFERLKTSVEDEKAKQDQLSLIIAKEQKTSNEVKSLQEEYEKAKKERQHDINKKNEVIRKLKEELREIKQQAEDATKKLESRSKQKEDLDSLQFQDKESTLKAEISLLSLNLNEICLRNREEEALCRKRKFKIESEVENWISKYDQDMEEKQAEIDDITAIFHEEQSQLSLLKSKHAEVKKIYDVIMEEKRLRDEKIKMESDLLKKKEAAAIKIQAVYRGFQVRRAMKTKDKDKGGKKDKGKKSKKKNLTSVDNSTIAGFLKNIENSIDQVLDVPVAPPSLTSSDAKDSVIHKHTASFAVDGNPKSKNESNSEDFFKMFNFNTPPETPANSSNSRKSNTRPFTDRSKNPQSNARSPRNISPSKHSEIPVKDKNTMDEFSFIEISPKTSPSKSPLKTVEANSASSDVAHMSENSAVSTDKILHEEPHFDPPGNNVLDVENHNPIEEADVNLSKKSEMSETVNIIQDSNDSSIPFNENNIAAPESEISDKSDLQTVLNLREGQLMKVMQNNAALTDSMSDLKSKLESSVPIEKNAMVENELRDLKIKFNQLLTERNELKSNVLSSNENLQKQVVEFSNEIQRKDQQISEFAKEGEKLSKLEMTSKQTIKKLKAKESEYEKLNKDLLKKLETLNLDNSNLKEKTIKSNDLEKRQMETIRNLSSLNEEQARQFKKTESDLISATQKLKEIESVYETTKKELVEERRQKEIAISTSQSEQLEGEKILNKALKMEYEEFKENSMMVETALKKDIFELRNSLERSQNEMGWKEDNFRKEILQLQTRIQESEARQEDLAFIRNEATKPLLRQIESLQSQYNASMRDWEKLEMGMTIRVREAESSRAETLDKEREARETNAELNIKIKTLESQISRQRQEKSKIISDLNDAKEQMIRLEETQNLQAIEIQNSRAKFEQESERNKSLLEIKLKSVLEEERRIWQTEKDQQISKLKSEFETQFNELNKGTESAKKESMSRSSSAMMDKLQLSVRQLENQLSYSQNQLEIVTKTRDGLAQELFKLSNEYQELKEKITNYENLLSEKRDLESRYTACLELLGEKTEKIEELSVDIQEMKQNWVDACMHEFKIKLWIEIISFLQMKKSKLAIIFPGQGSQFVGMGSDIYSQYPIARRIIDECDLLIPATNLKSTMFDGPMSTLTKTINAQPAILIHSIALLRILESEFKFNVRDCELALGHSLGEYAALVASGSLKISDAVKLVRLRGQAMENVTKLSISGTCMKALVITNDNLEKVELLMKKIEKALPAGDVAEISNINSSNQIVISGTTIGVDYAVSFIHSRGYSGRALPLPVSAPFHCSLMIPASKEMSSYLNNTDFQKPSIDVISNVTGTPYESEAAIGQMLTRQISETVQWHKSILYAKSKGVNNWLVIGPSKVLYNLLRKQHPTDHVISISTMEDIEKYKSDMIKSDK